MGHKGEDADTGKGGDGKGGAKGSKAGSGGESGKASGKSGKGGEEKAPLLPSEALRAAAEAERASAAASEKRASRASVSEPGDGQFERRLGRALLQNQQAMGAGDGAAKRAMAALMKAWDTNGDGELSKMELRQAVRGKKEGELGLKATNQEVDQLFDDFDADGGGTLDLKELRPCLKALIDAATAAEAEVEALRGMASSSLTRAEELAEAADAMVEVEAEEGRLHEISLTLPISVRFMSTLIKKGVVRLEDIAARFKTSDKGGVGKKAFVKGVLDEHIERATAEEVEAWFEERVQAELAAEQANGGGGGGGGGGAASINLLAALKAARLAAGKATDAEGDLKKELRALKKTARAGQQAIQAKASKLALEERDKELAAQAAVKAQEEAEAEAKAAKAQAKLERQAAKKAEAAAFEAKVAERRSEAAIREAKMKGMSATNLFEDPMAA